MNLLFVEDSSTDETVNILREMTKERTNIGYICLAESFGQGPAVFYGVRQSKADAVIMMDADGSHPVNEIPNLLAIYLSGVDIVQCIRKGAPNPKLYRRLASQVFSIFAQLLTGVNLTTQNCYFRLISRSVADYILNVTRFWKSVRFPLPPTKNFSVEMLEVISIERNSGQSKYHFLRLFSSALDVLLSLISWPRIFILIFIGGVAEVLIWNLHPVFSICFGIIIGLVIIRLWKVRHDSFEEKFAIVEKGGFIK